MRNIRLDLLVLCGAFALSLFFVGFGGSEEAPAASPPLSTHVLNTTTGKPPSGVNIILHKQTGGGWEELKKVKTDGKGRASDLYIPGKPLQAGTYRLVFETGEYFKYPRGIDILPPGRDCFCNRADRRTLPHSLANQSIWLFHLSGQLSGMVPPNWTVG